MRERELIVYRNLEDGGLVGDMAWLMENCGKKREAWSWMRERDERRAVLCCTIACISCWKWQDTMVFMGICGIAAWRTFW